MTKAVVSYSTVSSESKPKAGSAPPHGIRGAVGAVKYQSGINGDFIRKLAQSKPLRLAAAMRRMHPRGMPHRLIAE